MRFDPSLWNEFKPRVSYDGPQRRLEIILSAPAPLFIEQDGVTVCAGYGAEFKLDVTGDYSFAVQAKDVLCYVKGDVTMHAESGGDILTNAERMTHQSGAYLEVQRALRQHKLEMLGELQSMRDQLRAERARRAPPPPPALEPEPAPAADPAPAPAADPAPANE